MPPITALPSLEWPDGEDNMGGLQTIGYYALLSDFTAAGLPQPATRATASTLADLVTIANAPTFKDGKGWKRLYMTEDTGMVDAASQGEKDGKSFFNKFKGFHPGSKAEFLGWMRYVNNSNMICVGVDAEGLKRLVGSRQYPAKVSTFGHTTTETAAGRKGFTFEIGSSSPYPAPICTFGIAEEDASGSN